MKPPESTGNMNPASTMVGSGIDVCGKCIDVVDGIGILSVERGKCCIPGEG